MHSVSITLDIFWFSSRWHNLNLPLCFECFPSAAVFFSQIHQKNHSKTNLCGIHLVLSLSLSVSCAILKLLSENLNDQCIVCSCVRSINVPNEENERAKKKKTKRKYTTKQSHSSLWDMEKRKRKRLNVVSFVMLARNLSAIFSFYFVVWLVVFCVCSLCVLNHFSLSILVTVILVVVFVIILRRGGLILFLVGFCLFVKYNS